MTKKNETQNNPVDYIASLFKPTANKANSRKVWSIDLETVWLPFFTATNTMGVSNLEQSALGAPLRLALNTDGSVKFSKAGRPVIRVAKDISDSVKLVRENFVAGLQSYANKVAKEQGEAYTAMVKACQEAGKPILENDRVKLNEAIQKRIDEAIAQAEAEEQAHTQSSPETETHPEKELVPA